jgi:hypothetical protein
MSDLMKTVIAAIRDRLTECGYTLTPGQFSMQLVYNDSAVPHFEVYGYRQQYGTAGIVYVCDACLQLKLPTCTIDVPYDTDVVTEVAKQFQLWAPAQRHMR